MRQETIETLLAGEKSKLKDIFDWIQENCDQHQKEEISKLLGHYNFLFTFPNREFERCSHEISDDVIQIPPSRENIHYQLEKEPKEKVRRKLNNEIDTRKRLINGLMMEIEELQHQLQEVQD